MAGIYIHIPFCKQACHYCDFHFSTSLKYKGQLFNALINEIELQKKYLENETIETIYFGGGTPSLLSNTEINQLIEKIISLHKVIANPEITLEANPDDLTKEYLNQLSQTRINRLSIGVQSFREEDLKWMNRAHNANQAVKSILYAKEVGFNNITIDLIFGLPTFTSNSWEQNLTRAVELNVPHISTYSLTVEPKTALYSFIKKGKINSLSEQQAAKEYEFLMQFLVSQGYEHYEVSNFAKNGFYSKHNSSYWQGKKYLGIGPSAHSYNHKTRQWNISNNIKYIKTIESNSSYFEIENIERKDQVNELILTGLRTKWGIKKEMLFSLLNEHEQSIFLKEIKPFILNNEVQEKNNTFILTTKGKLIADYICSELFLIEE